MALVTKSFSDIITFTRASSATMFDSTGTLVYAPMNLLLWSEDFSQAAWVRTNANVAANTVVAPDGATTADTITFTGAGGDQRATQGGIVPSGAQCTFSVWLKGTAGQTVNIELDTTALTVTLTTAWVRYSVSGPSVAATAVCRAISRAGNTATVFDIWGAQLNIVNMQGGVTGSLLTYYPTTSAAYQGPRLDYNPATLAARGLLIEEQRTNLFQRSEEFNDAYWTPSAATVTTNSTSAPTGTNVADTLTENTSTGQHTLGSSTIAWIGNTQYTATFFVKANGRTRVDILFGTAGNWVNGDTARNANFDLTAGTVALAPVSPSTASIQSIGNGWYRCRLTATTTAAPTASGVFIRLCDATGSASYTGDGTSGIFLWGAQVEAGAFSTSYIPTTTTALTRSADVASVNTLSPWFNATAGTLFAQGILVGGTASTFPRMAALVGSNPNTDDIGIAWTANSGFMRLTVRSGGVAQCDVNGGAAKSAGSSFKVAGRYAVNDFQAAFDGTLGVLDLSGSLPTINALSLGGPVSFQPGASVWLQRVTFYPRGLSNAELQAITV